MEFVGPAATIRPARPAFNRPNFPVGVKAQTTNLTSVLSAACEAATLIEEDLSALARARAAGELQDDDQTPERLIAMTAEFFANDQFAAAVDSGQILDGVILEQLERALAEADAAKRS